jgi:peptide/nickel transport system substrate-binding protein
MSVQFSRALAALLVLAAVVTLAGCATPAPAPTQPTTAAQPAAAAQPTGAPAQPTAAAQSAAAPASGATPANIFVMCVNNQPKNIDPHVGSSNPEQEQQTAQYDTLLTYEDGGFTLAPALATDWKYSDDQSELTLTLRDNVKFHDGSTLTSEVAKFGLERSKTIGQGDSYLLDPIKSISTPDAKTLVLTLNGPNPEFVYGLTRIFIPSMKAVKDHEVNGDLAKDWFATHEAGSGPYVLADWVVGQKITLKRFDDYWKGWSGKHPDAFELRVVAEPATQRLLIERGECDYTDSITRDDLVTMSKNPDIKIENHESPQPYYIAMNMGKGPLANPKLREALKYAFDYDTVIAQAMMGYATKMEGPTPTQLAYHNSSLPKPTYDLAKASQILKDAGINPSDVSLKLIYLQPWVHEKNAALIFQASLAELGIKLELEGLPWATLVERNGNPDSRPDMSIYALYSPTPSIGAAMYPMLHSGSKHWSYFGYSNPEVDKLLDEVPSITDEAKREQGYMDLQKIIDDDSFAIYPFSENNIEVFRSNVQGYQYRPAWTKLLNYAGLHKD